MEDEAFDEDSVLLSPVGRGYGQPQPDNEVAFPLSIEWDFIRFVKDEKGALFTHQKSSEFKFYLEYLHQNLESSDPTLVIQHRNNRQFALACFELQDGCLYRQATEKPDGKGGRIQIPPRYVAMQEKAFEFITDIHRNLQYFGIYKIYKRVAERYYGITQAHVQWVVNCCMICNLKGSAKSKVPPIPIVSTRCLNRVYIDLMDFRTTPDKGYCWVLQIKDHFLCYIWLFPLEDKTAKSVVQELDPWIGQNGKPRRL
jgi:hypothetical protein